MNTDEAMPLWFARSQRGEHSMADAFSRSGRGLGH